MHPGPSGELKINILITGHKGYIGSVLVPILLDAGYKNLLGTDANLYNSSAYYNSPVNIHNLSKDIRDIQASDLHGINTIIHLAGLSNDPLGDLHPDLTYQINHHATVRLATLAKKAGVRKFVYSSSCSIYGKTAEDIVDEASPANPLTPYAKSKLLAEQGLSRLADRNFCPVYLRNATAYGISPNIRFDLVLNNLVAWAFTTGNILLKSKGTSWRPLVHIQDICSAIILMLHAPEEKISDQIFNIGIDSENFRIHDIAEIIESSVAGTKITFVGKAVTDIRSYKVAFNKLHNTFPDFGNMHTVYSGITELLETFRKYGLNQFDIEGQKYSRIECIKSMIANNLLTNSLRWAAA